MSSFAAALRSLPPMAVRLVLMRFLFFLGIQCGYFIGIVGTLTYTLSGGVADNAVGIVLLNACLVAGSFVGGPLLDRMGPRRYYAAVVVALVVAAAALVVAGSTRAGVFVGAALLGGAWGMADLVPKAFPAYLSDDAVVLKNLNSVIYTVSNASVVAGPLAGGAIAAAFSTNAVFWLLGACAIASAIPALGFRPLRVPVPAAGDDEGAKGASLREGFSAVFSLPALTLLFWSCFLSFFAYGAFDPIESLYYRDVLQVGVEWMGWLSSVSGVGGILGALLVTRIPAQSVNLRLLLAVLCSEGAFCLVYVGTPYVAAACVGQALLGVSFGMMMPLLTTLVQTHSPLSVIGRVNAVMGFGNNVAGTVPLLCAPALSRVLGVQGTLVAASAVVCVMPVVIGIVRRRQIGELVEQERALALGAEE